MTDQPEPARRRRPLLESDGGLHVGRPKHRFDYLVLFAMALAFVATIVILVFTL